MMLKLTDDDFYRIVKYMKKNYGINLEKKRVLIEGRLSGTAVSHGFDNFKDFFDYAFSDNTGEEAMRLVNKLTTNHTFFLREPEHFEFLKDTVLPYFEKKNAAERSLDIWCAASSTGQEPYSIAMTANEYFGTAAFNWNVRILATDVDTDVLRTAKEGVYTANMVKDVPPLWLTKYFDVKDEDHYIVSDRIKKTVEFRRFNLMDRIPFGRTFDLICCRNVMIYFEQQTKNDLVERFYDVTRDGGYLFIGHAESVGRNTKYTYIKPAVYRKIAGPVR